MPTSSEHDPQPSCILDGPGTTYRAGRGQTLRAKSWRAEALLRMFENVLEVGEDPDNLIVYASLGKAARNWEQAHSIATALLEMGESQTLVLQSGAAIGLLPTGVSAPMVVSAVNNTVGRWSSAERFYERAAAGQTMWGGLTAGAWQYIGRQGVLQGTYELLRTVAQVDFGAQPGHEAATMASRWLLTSGMGGMGSSQPISAKMLGLSSLTIEADVVKVQRMFDAHLIDKFATDLPDALAGIEERTGDNGSKGPIAVGLVGNAAEVYRAIAERGITPDIVTDQTAAHDARFGYLPLGYTLEQWRQRQENDPVRVERDARASMAAQVGAMLTMADSGAVVFENGNNLRIQAIEHLGASHADQVGRISGFMEKYLRPLFAQGIGPFRWVCVSGDTADQDTMDSLASSLFPDRPEVANGIALARKHVPQQGLPARSCWIGHGERSQLAVAANALVADGTLHGPVLFSRDHLDSAGMANPLIGNEGMIDGSDGVSDFPLLDGLLVAATGADLVAIHSGGGGYSGWMQSAGVSIVADGEPGTALRLRTCLDADSGLGVMRHATAGYPEALQTIQSHGESTAAPFPWFHEVPHNSDGEQQQ
ncbi:MAG: urocanate hydratase [Nakamurella sp.]